MNAKIAEKWITALESGKYKQGRHYLRNLSDAYCCLGVLCDLYLKETGEGEWSKEEGVCYSIADGSGGLLPESVRNWAEMRSKTGNYITRSLIADNDNNSDGGGKSFVEIAGIIKANVKNL